MDLLEPERYIRVLLVNARYGFYYIVVVFLTHDSLVLPINRLRLL